MKASFLCSDQKSIKNIMKMKFTQKLLPLFAMTVIIAGTISGCKKDDTTDNGNGSSDNTSNKVVVTQNITTDTKWTKDQIHELGGRITVEKGATLTIEAGSVIKGQAGTGANATALLVARGGKIMAEGRKDAPIIFTTVADEITPEDVAAGHFGSPNLDPDLNGLWGGLILCGNAPVSAPGDVTSYQIEGIPASDQNGLYGGNDPADNSGVVKYVSIRHGGSNIGEGNEINGITLGGVGSGTTLEHIEIVANQDDGIETFGGDATVKYILVWNPSDDMFDWDQDAHGTIDNFIGIGGPHTDHSMELDGPEGSADPGSGFTLKNGSLKGWNEDGTGGGEYADLRDKVTCTITNCYFFNFSDNSDIELDAGKNDDDPTISDNYKNGKVVFSNLEFNVSHLTSGNTTIDKIFSDQMAGQDVFATKAPGATIVTSPTVGATKAEFTGWTWADQNGELDDF